MTRLALLGLTLLLLLPAACARHSGESAEVSHGRELLVKAGCNDCHTEGFLAEGGIVPEERWLTGSKLGYRGPWGTQYPSNLRLLLAGIDEDQWLVLAKRMRTNSPMAWSMLPSLSDADLRDLYFYIRWLGPAGEAAPQALGPGVEPTTKFLYFPRSH